MNALWARQKEDMNLYLRRILLSRRITPPTVPCERERLPRVDHHYRYQHHREEPQTFVADGSDDGELLKGTQATLTTTPTP